MIDWSISVGSLLNLGVFLLGVVVFFANIKNDIKGLRNAIEAVETKQETLNEAVKQLGTILTSVAVQDQRIHHVERMIDELRHGVGFINK